LRGKVCLPEEGRGWEFMSEHWRPIANRCCIGFGLMLGEDTSVTSARFQRVHLMSLCLFLLRMNSIGAHGSAFLIINVSTCSLYHRWKSSILTPAVLYTTKNDPTTMTAPFRPFQLRRTPRGELQTLNLATYSILATTTQPSLFFPAKIVVYNQVRCALLIASFYRWA